MQENPRKQNNNSLIGLISVGLVIAFIVIFLIFLLRGETKVSGEYQEDIKDISLSCKKENLAYPFFSYDKSVKKETEINIIFGTNIFQSISLRHDLYYEDSTQINGSEAHNHAEMNAHFSRDNLDSEALNIKFARLSDKMSTSIYLPASKIDSVTAKYFLIDRYNDYSIPTTLDGLKQNYERKGFSCQVSE